MQEEFKQKKMQKTSLTWKSSAVLENARWKIYFSE